MEFERSLSGFIPIPCQIVDTGRQLVYRIFAYAGSHRTFVEIIDHMQRLRIV